MARLPVKNNNSSVYDVKTHLVILRAEYRRAGKGSES